MRISKDQYRAITQAHGEANHITTMLDDLREGLGHPTDLDKIRKAMLRMNIYLNQCDLALVRTSDRARSSKDDDRSSKDERSSKEHPPAGSETFL